MELSESCAIAERGLLSLRLGGGHPEIQAIFTRVLAPSTVRSSVFRGWEEGQCGRGEMALRCKDVNAEKKVSRPGLGCSKHDFHIFLYAWQTLQGVFSIMCSANSIRSCQTLRSLPI
jgi:hypothetical protein